MTTTRFSASGYAPKTTGSFTVQLGGTPSVGDQVVVYLGVSSEIVTHQPNYNNPTQWQLAGADRGRNNHTLTCWQHTWTAADTGSTATFSLSPAPSLGIGDKDLSSGNVVWAAVVLSGPTGLSEAVPSLSYDVGFTLPLNAPKRAHSGLLVASYARGATSFANSDASATLVQSIQDGNSCLSVWSVAAPVAGYTSTITAQTFNALTANMNVVDTSFWRPPTGGSFASVMSPTFGALATSGLLTPDGVSGQCFVETNHVPVSPLTNYTAQGEMYSVNGHTVGLSINWYTGNSYISTSSGGQMNVGTQTWTKLSFSANSPANADNATAIPVIGNTPPASAAINLDQFYLSLSSSPIATTAAEIVALVVGFNDNPSFIYNPGIIYEGPVAEDELLFRYTLARYYTLLNTSGVFTMTRYASTDDLFAATQIFSNNATVTSTDRTNILNSGLGGEFISA